VGKSQVPREVLYKTGRLTDEESALLKQHPTHGAEILQSQKHIDPLAIEVAFCHHMRDGGRGYPVTTLPIRVGPVASLVQVADMFEAITANEQDQPSTAGALKRILSTPGMRSRRALTAILQDRFTSSPPGSAVRLVSGERAIVIRTFDGAPQRPLVRIFEDADGQRLAQPYEIDLRDVNPAEPVIESVTLKPRGIPR
jgi:HD-GYP domain-containing protein (c-di-GMP phosphodiesterase class II)